MQIYTRYGAYMGGEKQEPTKGITDYRTGQTQAIPPDKDVLLIAKKRSVAAGRLMPINIQFAKIHDTAHAHMATIALTKTDQKILNTLLQYLQYNTNQCRHKNNKPITTKWLVGRTKCSQTAVYNALSRLVRYGFILRLDNAITINPYFAMRGKAIRPEVAELFSATEFCILVKNNCITSAKEEETN